MKTKAKGLLILLCLCVPSLIFAQAPPTFDDESPWGVTDVPFDDGVDLLIAAAIGYGLLKVWTYKRNEKLKKELLQD